LAATDVIDWYAFAYVLFIVPRNARSDSPVCLPQEYDCGMEIASSLLSPILAGPNLEGDNVFFACAFVAVPFCFGMLAWFVWWLIKRAQDLP